MDIPRQIVKSIWGYFFFFIPIYVDVSFLFSI